ncbi:GntR family transcriptional regulator [Sinomonas susongensis]|uniref:GntR family transcriptional regulator n=1 Tax=Sinomonas susongensis TaxID=1324851 RepID=UPI0011081FA8|nr:GntR family transcriptional regulator [Sinomonas susongensis]
MSFLSPVLPGSPATAAERAYASLAEDIVSGTLQAGSLITEGERADSLGMSRTPVREAFLRLAAEGLLRLYPKKGAIVTAEDDAAARHLLEARVMLEAESVRVAEAEARTTTESALRGFLDEQARARERGDALAFASADHAFHAAVASASRNPILDGFYAQLRPRLARLTHAVVRSGRSDVARFLAQHRELAELFAHGDAAGYSRLLRAHVGLGGRGASGS